MNPIKCSAHHESEAVYLCKCCGFLCNTHIYEQNAKKHSLLVVNDSIIKLYDAIATKQRYSNQCSIISFIKNKIISFLDNEKEMLLKSIKETQHKINKCLSGNLSIEPQRLNGIISHSIKLHTTDAKNDYDIIIQRFNERITGIFKSQKSYGRSKSFNVKKCICKFTNIDKAQRKKTYKKLSPINLYWKKPFDKKTESIRKSSTNNTYNGKIIKFSESEWALKYREVLEKYGPKDIKIQCAQKVLNNTAISEGK